MRFWAIFDRTLNIFAILTGIIIIFILIAVCTDTTLRFLLNSPITGVTEVTENSLLFVAFLSTAWVLKRGGHVNVDILLSRVNPRTRILFGIISSLIGVCASIVLVWFGTQVSWQHIHENIRTSTIMELPKGPILTIIPIGSFFLLIQFIRNIFSDWKKLRT